MRRSILERERVRYKQDPPVCSKKSRNKNGRDGSGLWPRLTSESGRSGMGMAVSATECKALIKIIKRKNITKKIRTTEESFEERFNKKEQNKKEPTSKGSMPTPAWLLARRRKKEKHRPSQHRHLQAGPKKYRGFHRKRKKKQPGSVILFNASTGLHSILD